MSFRGLLSMLVALSTLAGQAQDAPEGHLVAHVEMAGEGFMCPFLTPQVIDWLDVDAHWVVLEPTLSRIRWAMPLEKAPSQAGFEAILEAVGYPAGGAQFLQWDTVATVPIMPDP